MRRFPSAPLRALAPISWPTDKHQVLRSCLRLSTIWREYHLNARIIMPYTYAMLGFTALALASPIPKHPPHIFVISRDLPSTVETVHEVISGRGLIFATTDLGKSHPLPKAISISGTNTSAQGPASSDFPSQAFFSLSQDSQWGPGDISNIIFGFVTSILGTIAVGLTYCLYRRQSPSELSGSRTTYLPIIKLLIVLSTDESIELSDVLVSQPSGDDDTLPLEDLPPAYTSVDASTDSLGQQGAGSSVSPQP